MAIAICSVCNRLSQDIAIPIANAPRGGGCGTEILDEHVLTLSLPGLG